MYKIENKSNALVLTFGGLFTEDEAGSFMKDYESKTKNISKANTTLILDGYDLKCSNQSTLPMLQTCIDMYLKDGYKKIILVEMKDFVAKMQLKRLHTDFVGRVTFVNNFDEALKEVV